MNYVAILIGAVINMVVGMLWYSHVLFGKEWMRLIGKSEKDIKAAASQMNKLYGIIFISALILSYIMMVFIRNFGVMDVMGGVRVGFLAWLGFSAATTISDYLFAGRSLKLYLINSGYYLVVFLLLASIFSVWH